MAHLKPVLRSVGVSLDGLFIRLRDAEVVCSGNPEDQQYAGSHVLIAPMSGEGRLMMDGREIRLHTPPVFVRPAKRSGWRSEGKG